MSANPGTAAMDGVLKAGEAEQNTGNLTDSGDVGVDVAKFGMEAGGAAAGIPNGADIPGALTNAAATGMKVQAGHEFKGEVRDGGFSHGEPAVDNDNLASRQETGLTSSASPDAHSARAEGGDKPPAPTGDEGSGVGGDGGADGGSDD